MLTNGPSSPDSPCPLEVSLEVGGVQRMLTNLSPSSPDNSCPLEVSLEVGGVQRMLSIHVLTLRGSAVLWLLSLSVACSLALMLALSEGGGVSGGLGINVFSTLSFPMSWEGRPLSLSLSLSLSFGIVASRCVA